MFSFKRKFEELKERFGKYTKGEDKTLQLTDYFFKSSSNYIKNMTQSSQFWDVVNVYFKSFDISEFSLLENFYCEDEEFIKLITNTEFKKYSEKGHKGSLTVPEINEQILNNNKYIRDKLRENDPAFVMSQKSPMDEKVATIVEEHK